MKPTENQHGSVPTVARNMGVLLLLLLIVISYGLARGDFFNLLDAEWIRHYVTLHPLAGAFYFMGAFALLSAVAMPRQLIAFIGGYVFGFAGGTLISTLAVTLGAMLTFYFARLLLTNTIAGHWLRNQPALASLLSRHTFSKTIGIRFLPVGHNLLTNLLAGSGNTPAAPFFAGSFIGYLPQMLIFSLAGTGVAVDSHTKIVLGIGLLIMSSLISIRLYRHHKTYLSTRDDVVLSSESASAPS